MHSVFKLALFLFLLALLSACSKPTPPKLFEKLEDTETGVSFANNLTEEEGLDVFRYRNFYNGAGVGTGDFNRDGLPDIYFISNQEANQLFFNKGDFTFENVTEKAGVGGSRPWATGVTVADVNGDGWLDIYVSNSGDPGGTDRANELFINEGDGTFTEKAGEFGLADSGYTTHAAFFDYDHDGDLDCYVMNNSFRPVSSLPLENTRDVRDEGGGDRFYENRGGEFVDVSEEVGIYGGVIAFGLSVTLVDANSDGWTDIYISNDFFERDYLYINQQGKGFSEELERRMDQISLASMGADAEDINNDGLPEIFVTEMLPEKSARMKQVTSFESYGVLKLKEERGFYRQFQRNTLQLNEGNGRFVEIGRYANVDATGWSWGAMMFDMDNDANKEIFVTNGVYKDVTDQDFLDYFGSEENLRAARKGSEMHFDKFVDRMPSTPIPNYAFALDSALTYVNKSEEWGLDTPSFSNGSSFADFDNDGDMDLVVNNLNQPAFIYRNNSDNFYEHHYLKVSLEGDRKNLFGVGARLVAFLGEEKLTRHNYPSRGFQSSVDHQLLLGLGQAQQIDSLHVEWPGNRVSRYYEVPVDTHLTFTVSDAEESEKTEQSEETIFSRLSIDHRHSENDYNDFNHSALIYHKLSREGPPVAVADLNGDGMDDFFIGAATGSAGSLFLNKGDNSFEEVTVPAFRENATHEDVDAVFFDADGDGDQDLYVVSGGSEFGSDFRKFSDQLYINQGFRDGEAIFTKSDGLPEQFVSGSSVEASDFDGDGDIDLFVGGRSIPGEYGKPASSYLLQNDGSGRFSDVTSKYISQLRNIGMVTDASWTDYDNDGDPDLMLVGEWMPLTLFENRGAFFQRQFDVKGLENSEGWWESVTPHDLNGDGNTDYIAGNLGRNSMFKADRQHPIKMYVNDFDRNGSLDHVYAFKKGDEFIPYHLKDQLGSQLSFINAKFPRYEDYADKSISELFSEDQLQASVQLTAYELSSAAIMNNGDGSFELRRLPAEAQFSPIFDVIADDFNRDGEPELLMVGNFTGTRPQEGDYDANHGLLYRIGEDGTLKEIPYPETGLWIDGDVRDAEIIKSESGKLLVIAKNNGQTEIYEY